MPDPQPMCVECRQMLTVEEEDWSKDVAGYAMGERIATVKCADCDLEQRIEKYVETFYMSFRIEDVENEPSST